MNLEDFLPYMDEAAVNAKIVDDLLRGEDSKDQIVTRAVKRIRAKDGLDVEHVAQTDWQSRKEPAQGGYEKISTRRWIVRVVEGVEYVGDVLIFETKTRLEISRGRGQWSKENRKTRRSVGFGYSTQEVKDLLGAADKGP